MSLPTVINLSNTNPPAPEGTQNVSWQFGAETQTTVQVNNVDVPVMQRDVSANVPASGGGSLRQVKVNLDAADIIALGTTPYLLVDSPGSGFFVEIVSLTLTLHAGATPFAVSDANGLVLQYGISGTEYLAQGVYGPGTGFVDNATDSIITLTNYYAQSPVLDLTLLDGQALYLNATNPGSFSAGNGSMTATLNYVIDPTS